MALPVFDDYNRQTRWIDVFNRGDQPFAFTATRISRGYTSSPASGEVAKDQRLEVSIDWNAAPQGEGTGSITIQQKDGPAVMVHVQAIKPATPARDNLDGFVETNHLVSINAEHFTGRTAAGKLEMSGGRSCPTLARR